MSQVLIKSKVKAHTRRLKSGKSILVKEHEVNGFAGIHHDYTKKLLKDSPIQEKKRIHKVRGSHHMDQAEYHEEKASNAKDISETRAHGAAANWHRSQSSAHETAAARLSGVKVEANQEGYLDSKRGYWDHHNSYGGRNNSPAKPEDQKALRLGNHEAIARYHATQGNQYTGVGLKDKSPEAQAHHAIRRYHRAKESFHQAASKVGNAANLRKLYLLAKDTTGRTLDEYEKYINKNYGGHLPPHIKEAMSNHDNPTDFARSVMRFEMYSLRSSKSTTDTLDMLKAKTEADAETLEKGTVKQHTRRMKSGKVSRVKEHETSRHPKQFNVQSGVGSSKYSINDHDGVQTHNDGSPFFGIHLFNNKKKFEAKQKELKASGYTHRQQGPDKSIHTPKQLTRLYELSKDTTGKTLAQYERFLEIHLNGYVPPHYKEALDKADNAAEFVNMVHRFESKSKKSTDTLDMLKGKIADDAETLGKSTVKEHDRHLKSGKVVKVSEHMVNGIKGYHHPDVQKMPGHLKEDERAGFHEKMRDVHSKHYAEQLTAGVKAEVDGKKTDASHEHEAAADWHMRQHIAHHSEAKVLRGEGKENYFAAGAKISHAGHMKRNKANASSEKSLDAFPLIKSIMAKGLMFKKSGKDLREKLKLKMAGLHLQLAEESGRHNEEVRQANKNRVEPSDQKDGITRVPVNAEMKPFGDEESDTPAPMPDYPVESWKMRSLQREIGQCFLIENNIVDSHSYELSEYDLKQYGF